MAAELRLLAKLFTPEEAALAARLRLTLETPAEIAARTGGDPQALRGQLKEMAKRGLITAGRAATGGLGFGLMPFVVGIYEMQAGRIDAELAQLFEDVLPALLPPLAGRSSRPCIASSRWTRPCGTTWRCIPTRARRKSSPGPRPGR